MKVIGEGFNPRQRIEIIELLSPPASPGITEVESALPIKK